MFGFFLSILSSIGIKKLAVFPVPFFALAKMFDPERMIGMEISWIGDGASNPISNIPFNKLCLRQKSSQLYPLVEVTSSVFTLVSAGGITRSFFHLEYMK